MRLLILLTVLFSFSSLAKDLSLKYGLGINNHQNQITDVKLIALSIDQDIFGILREKYEAGLYVDNTRVNSRVGYLAYMIGVEPRVGQAYFNGTSGLGMMSGTDKRLGSAFQFFHEFGFGVIDKNDRTRMGVYYKHISNAGITQPNMGRDFIGIQMGVNL